MGPVRPAHIVVTAVAAALYDDDGSLMHDAGKHGRAGLCHGGGSRLGGGDKSEADGGHSKSKDFVHGDCSVIS